MGNRWDNNGWKNPNKPDRRENLSFIKQSKVNKLSEFFKQEKTIGRSVERSSLYNFFFEELYSTYHPDRSRRYRQMMDLHDFLVKCEQLDLTPVASGFHIVFSGTQSQVTGLVATKFTLLNDIEETTPKIDTRPFMNGNVYRNLFRHCTQNRNTKNSSDGNELNGFISYINSTIKVPMPTDTLLPNRDHTLGFIKAGQEKAIFKLTNRKDSITVQLVEDVEKTEFQTLVDEWFRQAPFNFAKGVLNEKNSPIIEVRTAKWSEMPKRLQEKFSDRYERATKKAEKLPEPSTPDLAEKVVAHIVEPQPNAITTEEVNILDKLPINTFNDQLREISRTKLLQLASKATNVEELEAINEAASKYA